MLKSLETSVTPFFLLSPIFQTSDHKFPALTASFLEATHINTFIPLPYPPTPCLKRQRTTNATDNASEDSESVPARVQAR